jgi:hypothetical protein
MKERMKNATRRTPNTPRAGGTVLIFAGIIESSSGKA